MVHKFIQKAISCKGCLRAWAKRHHFIRKDGTIDLEKAHHYAETHHLTKELKRIHLAHTLGVLSHRHEPRLDASRRLVRM